MTKEFENYIRRLCREHDLSSISVHIGSSNNPAYAFYAYAHWDKIADEIPCKNSYGASIEEAVSEAIRKSHETRTAIREELK